MSSSEQPVTKVQGACLCGGVVFEVGLPALFCGHCHCSICRRAHGAAYVTWFGAAKDRLEVVSGSELLVDYRSSEHGVRSFCGRCGSALFCEIDDHPGMIDVVLANMNGDIDLAPQMHVFYSDRVAWVKVGDDLPLLGGASGMEPLEL